MKVLQVLYSGLGGHASVVFSLIDGDNKQQWNHSLLFYGIEPLNEQYVQKATARKIAFSAIRAVAGKPWQSWRKYYVALKNAQPDLVLLHSSGLLIPTWCYCKLFRKKLITIEHTPNQVKRRTEKWTSLLAQYLSRAVVLLTQDYFDELKKMLGKHFHEKKTVVIPNGIDINYFVPVATTRKIGHPVRLGMAARFSSQKDQALLIEVIEKLEKKAQPRYQLWLAGDGEHWEEVKKLARDNQVDNITFFTGNLDESKLLSFFQQLDIYLHASKGETMSTSIMQAMACGLPVIASDIPGINNLLNEEIGELVSHTVESFVDAINKVTDDPFLCNNKKENARRFTETHLSNRKMFELYNQLIKNYA